MLSKCRKCCNTNRGKNQKKYSLTAILVPGSRPPFSRHLAESLFDFAALFEAVLHNGLAPGCCISRRRQAGSGSLVPGLGQGDTTVGSRLTNTRWCLRPIGLSAWGADVLSLAIRRQAVCLRRAGRRPRVCQRARPGQAWGAPHRGRKAACDKIRHTPPLDSDFREALASLIP